MARALGEKEEIVDVIGRKRLGLFACHITQKEYLSILECCSQHATEISRLQIDKLSAKSLSKIDQLR